MTSMYVLTQQIVQSVPGKHGCALRPRSGCCQGASLTKSQIGATSRSHRCTAKPSSTFIRAHTTVHGRFQGLDIGENLLQILERRKNKFPLETTLVLCFRWT